MAEVTVRATWVRHAVGRDWYWGEGNVRWLGDFTSYPTIEKLAPCVLTHVGRFER